MGLLVGDNEEKQLVYSDEIKFDTYRKNFKPTTHVLSVVFYSLYVDINQLPSLKITSFNRIKAIHFSLEMCINVHMYVHVYVLGGVIFHFQKIINCTS